MRIVVCIKQVADSRAPIRIAPDGIRVEESDLVTMPNPTDLCAVEGAVRMAEQRDGEVILVSLGDRSASHALRQGLAMGAQRAILVDRGNDDDPEASFTASVLAHVIEPLRPDLVLCGVRSADNGSGRVGAGVAEALGIPHVCGVTHLMLDVDDGGAVVLRRLERGYRERLHCGLPALLTVDVDLATPRYPALPALIDALTRPIETIAVHSLGISHDGFGASRPATHVVSLTPPRPRPKRIFTPSSALSARDRLKAVLAGGVTHRSSNLLEGQPREVAMQVVAFLSQQGVLPNK